MAIAGFAKLAVHFQNRNAHMMTITLAQRDVKNANLCVNTTDAIVPKIAKPDIRILQPSVISKRIVEDIARFVVNIQTDVLTKQRGSLTKKDSLSVSTDVSNIPAKALVSVLRRASAILRTAMRAFVHTVLMPMIAKTRPS